MKNSMMRVRNKRVCNAKREMLMLASAVLMLCACGDKVKEYDATGTFEATETTVFAEQIAFPANGSCCSHSSCCL